MEENDSVKVRLYEKQKAIVEKYKTHLGKDLGWQTGLEVALNRLVELEKV